LGGTPKPLAVRVLAEELELSPNELPKLVV
jgi:hypothetical protein